MVVGLLLRVRLGGSHYAGRSIVRAEDTQPIIGLERIGMGRQMLRPRAGPEFFQCVGSIRAGPGRRCDELYRSVSKSEVAGLLHQIRNRLVKLIAEFEPTREAGGVASANGGRQQGGLRMHLLLPGAQVARRGIDADDARRAGLVSGGRK